jgi:hypothetical protein
MTAGSGATARGRPRTYWLAVPSDWWRIDLDPRRRVRSVRALLDRQFAGHDDLARLRRQTEANLVHQAEEAAAGGGIELFVTTEPVAGVPLPATLLVSLAPPAPDPGVVTPSDLVTHLAATHPAEQATLADLPAGLAVRHRYRAVSQPDPDEAEIVSVNLTTYLAVPEGEGAYLMLSFSTPVEPLGDAMAGLFDAISATVRWVW